MNETQKLICGIFILLCLGLIGAIEASTHIEYVPEQPYKPQDIIVIDYDLGPTVITADQEYIEIRDILTKNDWDNWESEEQHALTLMMQHTAGGIEFDYEFMEYINSMNRLENIFNTYIDLMKHAGY